MPTMVFMMNAADKRPISSHSSALAPSGFLRSVQRCHVTVATRHLKIQAHLVHLALS